MQIAIISIFPEMFRALTDFGVVSRAFERNLVALSFYNPRDFASGGYRRVDERPYGGGPGMVLMAEPLFQAVTKAKHDLGEATPVYLLSPQGEILRQKRVRAFAQEEKFILICGRYEGIDQRFIDECVDFEISIGEYIVSGGELPAMIMIDALCRLLPGVLSDPESALLESFSNDNELDYAVYTAPRIWHEREVPAVLLSGDHKKIAAFRQRKLQTLSSKP